MLRETIQTLCVLLLVALFSVFIVSNSSAEETKYAKYYDEGTVALGNGLVTGQTIEDIQEEVDGSIKEMDLDKERFFNFYKIDYDEGSKNYIAINGNTGKLVYELNFYDVDEREETENFLEKKCGEPVEARDTLFYHYKDIGYKVMSYDDDHFQLWVGSVARWDNAAEDGYFNEFEK